MCCYILLVEVRELNIIIQRASMIPVYEQIVNQFKHQIVSRTLNSQDPLPSVRKLAKELHVSALTVKKAYDQLEQDGLINTVQGKGSFVAEFNPAVEHEEELKEVQDQFEKVIQKSKQIGMTDHDIRGLIDLLLEE